MSNIAACWRAANYLFVGQSYLKANPLLEVPLNAPAYQAAIAGTLGTTMGINCRYMQLNQIINAFDANMIYIIDPGYQKLAIRRHQTAVRTVSMFWGAMERRGEGAVQASHGHKHGLERGSHALSRQR